MIATLLAALALQVPSAAELRERHCDAPEAQQDMNFCANADFQRADADLNRAYREAIAGVQAGDRQIDRRYDQSPSSEALLRAAQRAWVVFRDAQCAAEADGEARGGSMEPMVYDGCRTQLTRARIAQLRADPER